MTLKEQFLAISEDTRKQWKAEVIKEYANGIVIKAEGSFKRGEFRISTAGPQGLRGEITVTVLEDGFVTDMVYLGEGDPEEKLISVIGLWPEKK